MKKRELLLLLLALTIVIYQLGLVYSQSGGVGISMKIIDISSPVVNLISPINSSGDIDGNITFFYNVSDSSDVDNCSLIINNKFNATNTSIITKSTRLSFTLNNTAIGSYNWSINCTDNLGYVGSSAYRAVAVNSMSNFNGSGTNLSQVTNISNVTNFVIELTTFGKINFSEGVDLSQGLDLDKYINISSNRIELNSTALRELNKSATLYLYGLTFTNPRVLMDGAVCPSSICQEISYSGGTFAFNATHFTVYSSEETPAGVGDTGGGGGGGGGSGGGGGGGGIPLLPSVAPAADFSIDKKSIKVKLNPGESKRENIKIENTGTISLEIEIDLRNLEDFIHFPTGIGSYSFTLDPKESKTIQLTFNAPEGREPGVISGKILIKGGSIEKSITTVIEIQSEKPLFDVDMEIPTQFQQVFSGSEVLAQINIFNIMGISKVDVTVDYGIKDKEGTEIISSQETIGVEIKTSFVRSLKLPENIKPGKYVFYAKVSYAGLTATASSLFDVVEKKFKLDEIFTPINLIIVISFAVLTIFLIFIMLALLNLTHLHRKEIKQGMEKPQIQIPDKKVPTAEELLAEIEKTKEFEETERKDAIKPIKEKVIERLQIKPEMSKERLNEQLKLLEESFKSGLISKYAYEKDKKKIGNMLKDL